MGETPRHGSRGWRRDGLPDAGASEDLDFEPSGVRITVRSRGFRRHGQISWRQVASWIDTGLTPARLGIITAASRLHIYTYARRDQMIAAGKDNIDAAIRELGQISTDAIDAALGAALSARDADAPVPPARPGKPAYRTTRDAHAPGPGRHRGGERHPGAHRRTRGRHPGSPAVTPADIKGAIRWWIGDSLPEYARALASPEAMRAWIRRQASGPASRPGMGSYDSAVGRYYSASPEGLRTSKGSDTRTAPFILWEEIPAWIQPGLSASLRDRLAAAEPRQAPGRKRQQRPVRPPAPLTRPARRMTRYPGRCARPSTPPGPPSRPRRRPHPPTWTTPAPVPEHGHRARTPARQSREDRPARDPGTAATSRTPSGPAAPPHRPGRSPPGRAARRDSSQHTRRTPAPARRACTSRRQRRDPAWPRTGTSGSAAAGQHPGPAHRRRHLPRHQPPSRLRDR